MSNRARGGFASLRTILALLIVISILPLVTRSMLFLAKLKFDTNLINDELALMQLRRTLMISYDVENNGTTLTFIKSGKENYLSMSGNRLILQPGYQIVLNDVDDVYFYDDGNCLMMKYDKNNKSYETAIFKSKGIYLDNFFDSFDVFD